jgi:hypothetical protein
MRNKKKPDAIERNELLRLRLPLEGYKRRPHELTYEFLRLKLRNFLGYPVSDEQIQAEVLFLLDKGYLSMRFHELGATKYFHLTAEGVLIVERQYANHLD